MKKRTLLCGLNFVYTGNADPNNTYNPATEWFPPYPEPSDYGGPFTDAYKNACKQWNDITQAILDKIDYLRNVQCNRGEWSIRFTDKDGNEHKIDQDSTDQEKEDYQKAWNEYVDQQNQQYNQQ